MLCLGIESTAHTFGIGIVSFKGEVIVNEKITFKGEGMDLRALTEFHVKNFNIILEKSIKKLKQKNYNLEDIKLISFSRGPGIGNSLKVGALVAKTLALKLDIPLVGVNHIKAHLEIGKLLTNFKDPLFLYVSGVNTQLIALDKNNRYKIYGETEDIGLGNLLDSFGRLANLEFPSGPSIEKYARGDFSKSKERTYIELPYTIKGLNISISGIYSNLKKKIEDFENSKPIKISENKFKKYEDKDEFLTDLCYSLQETTFSMLIEIVERIIAYVNKKEFTIVGGVASNERLREMAYKMGEDRNIKVKFFPLEYCMDNGAMIAWEGILNKKKSSKSIRNLKPLPYINIESLEC